MMRDSDPRQSPPRRPQLMAPRAGTELMRVCCSPFRYNNVCDAAQIGLLSSVPGLRKTYDAP
jgi:hypothetical protein